MVDTNLICRNLWGHGGNPDKTFVTPLYGIGCTWLHPCCLWLHPAPCYTHAASGCAPLPHSCFLLIRNRLHLAAPCTDCTHAAPGCALLTRSTDWPAPGCTPAAPACTLHPAARKVHLVVPDVFSLGEILRSLIRLRRFFS